MKKKEQRFIESRLPSSGTHKKISYIIDVYDGMGQWVKSTVNVQEEGLESYIKELKKIPLVWRIEISYMDEEFNYVKIRTYQAKRTKAWRIIPDCPEHR